MVATLKSVIEKFKKFDPDIKSSRVYIQEYLCEHGIIEQFVHA